MRRSSLIKFILLLLLVSWVAGAIVLGSFDTLDDPDIVPWLVLLMYLPSVFSLVFLLFNPEARQHVRWRLGKKRYVIFSPIIPGILCLLILAVTLAVGWGESEYFTFSPATVDISKGPWKLGLGEQNWPVFLANFFMTVFLFGVLNGFAAIGEEFGWRGFLQHHLVDKFGLVKGVTLLGLTWAIWHLPLILHGYNYPENPFLGSFVLFPLLLVASSFVLAWLTLRANSFWPAVFFHGSINGAYQAVIGDRLSLNVSQLHVDLLEIAVMSGLALLCLIDLKRRPGAWKLSD